MALFWLQWSNTQQREVGQVSQRSQPVGHSSLREHIHRSDNQKRIRHQIAVAPSLSC